MLTCLQNVILHIQGVRKVISYFAFVRKRGVNLSRGRGYPSVVHLGRWTSVSNLNIANATDSSRIQSQNCGGLLELELTPLSYLSYIWPRMPIRKRSVFYFFRLYPIALLPPHTHIPTTTTIFGGKITANVSRNVPWLETRPMVIHFLWLLTSCMLHVRRFGGEN